MKPLHLCCADGKYPNKTLQYIQVKDGVVNATDGSMLIRMPVEEVIPDIIKDGEELYFLGSEWKTLKIFKAMFIEREGLTFTAKDKKKNIIGVIRALDAEAFEKLNIGRFPDVTTVIPDGDKAYPADAFSINANKLHLLGQAFGAPFETLTLKFNGRNRIISVTHINEPGNGYIMPLMYLVEEPEEAQPEQEPEPEPDYTEDYSDLL
ncbi:MAG TPA: hypothetical protein VFX43_18925 [Chitinophagaceae bacterium]|nr:hypothetical protein [Chitinophagaceae bacterium]